jgi:Histidine kinase
MTPRWRLGAWAARAWRRMGWRHVLLALLISIVRIASNPLGGIFFPPAPLVDPVLGFLDGSWAVDNIPLIYAVLIADEAFDDGVPPLRAYGLAVIAMVAFIPITSRLYGLFLESQRSAEPGLITGIDEGVPQLVWWMLVTVYECGFGLWIYAYWRVTQRAMRRAQAAETERVRSEQRVQTARLLALQSRVEPQLLFDALRRVGDLHDREPQAADALLAELIALLRSMQPNARTDTSTVEREFALVEAWLCVSRSAGRACARTRLQMTPDSATVGIAPMLLLPLLREVLAVPRAMQVEWRLSAELVRQRLLVTLQPGAGDETDAPGVLAQANLAPLHEQLSRLFGQTAHLAVSAPPPCLTLDLPLLLEDHDDHGTDR